MSLNCAPSSPRASATAPLADDPGDRAERRADAEPAPDEEHERQRSDSLGGEGDARRRLVGVRRHEREVEDEVERQAGRGERNQAVLQAARDQRPRQDHPGEGEREREDEDAQRHDRRCVGFAAERAHEIGRENDGAHRDRDRDDEQEIGCPGDLQRPAVAICLVTDEQRERSRR